MIDLAFFSVSWLYRSKAGRVVRCHPYSLRVWRFIVSLEPSCWRKKKGLVGDDSRYLGVECISARQLWWRFYWLRDTRGMEDAGSKKLYRWHLWRVKERSCD